MYIKDRNATSIKEDYRDLISTLRNFFYNLNVIDISSPIEHIFYGAIYNILMVVYTMKRSTILEMYI